MSRVGAFQIFFNAETQTGKGSNFPSLSVPAVIYRQKVDKTEPLGFQDPFDLRQGDPHVVLCHVEDRIVGKDETERPILKGYTAHIALADVQVDLALLAERLGRCHSLFRYLDPVRPVPGLEEPDQQRHEMGDRRGHCAHPQGVGRTG